MSLSVSGAFVSFSGENVLEDINFEIKNREKIAVVGRNGCGKTTLLRLIAGELEAEGEKAQISLSSGSQIGYVKQISFDDLSVTLSDELEKAFSKILDIKKEMDSLQYAMAQCDEKAIARFSLLEEVFKNAGGYYYKKEKETIISKFGFSLEKDKPLSCFSGGQLTKIAFMKLLLSKPDILLLDEPTNHLDMETVEWLEDYLKSYKSAVVIVSHDRMFLDKIVDKVYEIEHKKIHRYNGNYTAFLKEKRAIREKQQKDYQRQQSEIEKTSALIERFRYKATKAAMVQSRIKALEKAEQITAPEREDDRSFFADFTPQFESGNDVLELKDLEVGYNTTLAKVSFSLKKGDKLGIIGANGKGKSTLLKTLMGYLPSRGGRIKQGVNVRVGYFDQNLTHIGGDKTVFEDYSDTFNQLTNTEVRSDLGAFLFRGEDVFKKISVLSGGEKVRLALCKILKRKPNFLILDEPTNHMDIIGKHSLEQRLKEYPATLICVSHDRYFIKEVCNCLLVFEEDRVVYYPYTYDEYEQTVKTQDVQKTIETREKNEIGEKKKGYYSSFKELSKIEKKISKIETEIGVKEEEIENLKESLNSQDIASDYERLTLVTLSIDEKEKELEKIMTLWEELSEKREELSKK